MPEIPTYPKREELDEVLDLVSREARSYLAGLDDRPVLTDGVDESLERFAGGLPETGLGAAAALRRLIEDGLDGTAATSGPKCYHFVIGGATPAALGADWLATLLDQMPYTWVSSPLGLRLEALSLDWLKELFGLPKDWAGAMTTGATMANFVCLAAARQWWAERHGVDASEMGIADLPRTPVLTGGYVHASAIKVLSLIGIGRSSVRKFTRDAAGRLDLERMERALKELDGAPAILIGNAGEVNAGDFDPIDRMADLAEEYGAWLHVDGAFGLFARVSPEAAALCEGVERAHSVTVDGHKWLNVPYDCGFAFVEDYKAMAKAFAYRGDYLPDPNDPHPTFIGPESSRRARAFAVWATLAAYGREGYRALVEGHLELARHLADLVDAAPELERLADVPLNIVCFRYNPGDRSERELDELNRRLGEAILSDGRVFAGTTIYQGRVALRPAIANWRTRREHIDEFVQVVRELANDLQGP